MINSFFNSRNFAVIGASRDENKVGNIIFKNLLANGSFKVYPVNPNAEEVLNQKCFSSLLNIKEKIDLVIIAVKANLVPEILNQCHTKDIHSVIIISAGFSESGNSELENKVKGLAHEHKINLLGPNVLGILNAHKNLNASFFNGMPRKGSLTFLSQSGAIGVGILDKLIQEGLGISSFVSLGNSAVLDFSDFIEYFNEDPFTDFIALYMESLPVLKGKRFIETCKKCSKKIFVLKAGKTPEGKKAALSHTSALASESGVYESIFKQAGIIEFENIEELFNITLLYSKFNNLGNKTCVITNAGGLGVLVSDYCYQNKVLLPDIPENIKEKLNSLLRLSWSCSNPIDILGDATPERYEKTLRLLEKEDFFDFFILLLTPQHMTNPFELSQFLFKLKKPLVACYLGGTQIQNSLKLLKNKIHVFTEPETMVKALGKVICKEK